MKFYNRYYLSNFEELITYYPRYYRDVFEMVAILKAFGQVTETLEDHIEQTYLNNFIMQADEYTVGIWERILQITGTAELSLYQRKCAIIARLNSGAHVGEPEIREIISNYTDNAVSVDFARGIITVIIDGYVFGEEILLDTLLRRIPAHLRLFMQIHIRRVFRQDLLLYHGGAVVTTFHPQPAGEDRTSILPLPVRNGGYVAGTFHPLPVGQDRTANSQIVVANGGASVSSFKPDPVSEDKTALSPVSVAHGGFLPPGLSATPPEVQKATTGRSSGAGGLFYQTHTKSKLIE